MKKNFSIEVKNLIKKYNKADKNAVDDISFSVEKGEFFTLLGPNGAGKTTTISILTTTLSKTSGQITVAGLNIDNHSSQVRQKVGIIFQKPSLDQNLTAEENVRFHTILYGLYDFKPTFTMMPKDYQDRVNELADLLEIKADLHKPIKSFSGGMKRKLEIIRSLMHEPEVLFLDEPTTGLDPSSRRNLWEYLQTVRAEKGMTIFLTTHYLDEAEGADQVCIINHGRIISQGTPRQIKQKLLESYILVDSSDRDKLSNELTKKKIDFDGNGPYRIQFSTPTPQSIINQISTELTELEVISPSLEQAYLSIINQPKS